MTAKQTRRLLIVAFVLSFLIHLLVVLFVRWPFRPPEEQVQIVHVTRVRPIRIARVTPPPPPPSPAPTVAPATAPPRRPAHQAVHGTTAGPTAATPAPTPAAPSPTPAPTATLNCAKSDTPVEIAASPAPPEIPAAARTTTTGGIARINVAVNAAGAVTAASIAQTTGDSQLDLIAVEMAREARYTPATHGCKPVASQYAYTVRFVAW
jgi:TonB family protein